MRILGAIARERGISTGVKLYIKSVFGATSPQYKALRGLRFITDDWNRKTEKVRCFLHTPNLFYTLGSCQIAIRFCQVTSGSRQVTIALYQVATTLYQVTIASCQVEPDSCQDDLHFCQVASGFYQVVSDGEYISNQSAPAPFINGSVKF
jgi:hypothetical protein